MSAQIVVKHDPLSAIHVARVEGGEGSLIPKMPQASTNVDRRCRVINPGTRIHTTSKRPDKLTREEKEDKFWRKVGSDFNCWKRRRRTKWRRTVRFDTHL